MTHFKCDNCCSDMASSVIFPTAVAKTQFGMEALIAKLHDVEAAHVAETQRAVLAEPPPLLDNVQLHDYQVLGMRWLLAKRAQGLSPILGDEMGLGKTLQVIAFIAALISDAASSDKKEDKKKKKARYLIVAPLSVLPNWMEQFERFAPRAATAMYIGAQADRAALQTTVESSAAEVCPFCMTIDGMDGITTRTGVSNAVLC